VAAICGVGSVLLVALLLSLMRKKDKTNGASTTVSHWDGATVSLLGVCLGVGWIIRFLIPIPSGVTAQAWSMLAIFVAMICGVITEPLPASGVTIFAMAVAAASNTISFDEAVQGFTDQVVWMVLLAFFFASCLQKTGLGQRLALTVIKAVGGTTLGLAYGLNAAELVVAAALPSSAARAAALFYPLTVSVSKASGSDPANGTQGKCGAFLVECCYQATATSSCLFLTGAAQNFLILKLASGVGIDFPSPFGTWFMAALGPSLVSYSLTPLLAFFLLPPEAKTMPDAPRLAKEQLQAMGPMKDDEKVFGVVMLSMVGLWATASNTGIPPVVTALCGQSLLMLTGISTWDECAKNSKAWGTFVSFASLVGLAGMLKKLGIVNWFASTMTAQISAAGLDALPAFLLILTAYWLVHYLFASQVAHVSALFQPFLLMMVKTGTPEIPAVLTLAFTSNLFMTLTPYASAQSAVMFGGNFITVSQWYKAGFAFFVFYYVVWICSGAVWWKMIGLL
jgi:DASS family divalent anion:Na+ symporter